MKTKQSNLKQQQKAIYSLNNISATLNDTVTYEHVCGTQKYLQGWQMESGSNGKRRCCLARLEGCDLPHPHDTRLLRLMQHAGDFHREEELLWLGGMVFLRYWETFSLVVATEVEISRAAS